MMRNYIIIILLCLISTLANAQELENDFQYRINAGIEWEPVKNLEIEFGPQIRFDNKGVDRYLLDLGVKYKTFGFLTWGVDCRMLIEPKKNSTELNGRYGAHISAKKKWGRFTPSLRIYYTNYIVSENKDDHFLRYKLMLKYDIKKCKFTPFISAEASHQLVGNLFYKMRYAIGGEYNFKEYGAVSLKYGLDVYHQEARLKHIFELGYKYSFKYKEK